MSQVCVERVIGALATDEGLRLRFHRDPRAVLMELIDQKGWRLTHCEQWALAKLDPEALERFANEIDGRLQKASLGGGET
ncbi:MAG TPA: Os1348 family NHLP clan protein [Candidatus Sulfotelmatobacter sp.]|nr:Os1348 family NHLP clan protein [Candidatus Sulfotelmatobacter sp.]